MERTISQLLFSSRCNQTTSSACANGIEIENIRVANDPSPVSDSGLSVDSRLSFVIWRMPTLLILQIKTENSIKKTYEDITPPKIFITMLPVAVPGFWKRGRFRRLGRSPQKLNNFAYLRARVASNFAGSPDKGEGGRRVRAPLPESTTECCRAIFG